MALPFPIDLHIHTAFSDGTDTPEALLVKVRGVGLGVFSVTDHDAVLADGIIPPLLMAGDPSFIPGVEFSCRDEEGKYHILGYGFDPEAPAIRQLVDMGHGYRMAKVRSRLDLLKTQYGFTFSEEEIDDLLARPNPGKPHIGNLMVAHGYAPTRAEAIRAYIDRLPVKSLHIRPEEAIRGILAAGGIPVLAHPAFGDGDQRITGAALDERVRRLMGFELRGVEAFYSGFSAELRGEVLSLADRYGLYVTAGSDHHGTNKSVRLGDTGLGEADPWPEGLQRFLKDAGV